MLEGAELVMHAAINRSAGRHVNLFFIYTHEYAIG